VAEFSKTFDLSMGSTGLPVMTPRNDSLIHDQHRAHDRIWAGSSDGPPSFIQSRAHETLVILG